MSTMSPAPQPGAVHFGTKLPHTQMIWQPGCPPLAPSDAVTFVWTVPVKLDPRTVLWRVYGGNAFMTGSYWSTDDPAGTTEGHWRGSEAVQMKWNAGTSVAKLVVGEEGKWVWSGSAAPQPAQDTASNDLPGYLLPGGGAQMKVILPGHAPSVPGEYDITPAGSTPWSRGGAAPPPPSPARSAGAGDLAGTDYAALGQMLSDLADTLEAGGAGDDTPDAPDAEVRQAQASLLREQRVDLATALGQGIDEQGQIAVQHQVLAAVGLRRNIDVTEGSDADHQLERLVAEAHSKL